jgi:predicted transcriptional regulator
MQGQDVQLPQFPSTIDNKQIIITFFYIPKEQL